MGMQVQHRALCFLTCGTGAAWVLQHDCLRTLPPAGVGEAGQGAQCAEGLRGDRVLVSFPCVHVWGSCDLTQVGSGDAAGCRAPLICDCHVDAGKDLSSQLPPATSQNPLPARTALHTAPSLPGSLSQLWKSPNHSVHRARPRPAKKGRERLP